MELWNLRNICQPPNHNTELREDEIDISNLKQIIDNALKILNLKYILHKEAAIFSRYMYKNKRRFRGHKQILCMEKVKRCLQRYLSLRLDDVYSNFGNLIATGVYMKNLEVSVRAPSKQMLEYLLVKTQGFSKIMFCVSVACEETAPSLIAVIQRAETLNTAVLGLALISRLWYCAKYFVMSACHWYSQLRPYLRKLKLHGTPWLPNNYKFPEHLGLWLGRDPVTGEIISEISDVQKISEEIQKDHDHKDMGIEISRKSFYCEKNKEKRIPLLRKNRFFLHKNTKSSWTVSNYSSDSHCVTSIPESGFSNSISSIKDELEDAGSDLGELIDREEFHSVKKRLVQRTPCSEFGENDVGSSKYENSHLFPSKIPSHQEFEKTILGSSHKSETLNLFMAYTREICSTSHKEGGIESITEELHPLGDSKESRICEDWNTRSHPKKGEEDEVEIKELVASKSGVGSLCEERLSRTKLYEEAHKEIGGKRFQKEFIVDKILKGPSGESNNIFKRNEQSQIGSAIMKSQIPNSDLQIKSKSARKKRKKISQKCEDTMGNDFSVCKGETENPSKTKGKAEAGRLEIIERIRSINDVKVFLQTEKKARAKGRNCVTSQLSGSDWNVLMVAVGKTLNKAKDLKLKGKKHTNSALEEIRSTIISFV